MQRSRNNWREMMQDKAYSFLGLAAKAGKLISGDETCERALKAGKVHLVIVSEDASGNTRGNSWICAVIEMLP